MFTGLHPDTVAQVRAGCLMECALCCGCTSRGLFGCCCRLSGVLHGGRARSQTRAVSVCVEPQLVRSDTVNDCAWCCAACVSAISVCLHVCLSQFYKLSSIGLCPNTIGQVRVVCVCGCVGVQAHVHTTTNLGHC